MRDDCHDGLRQGPEEVSLSVADAYDRFMGRYSGPLAAPFADFAGVPLDGRVLDVGCGPGALTAELAGRVGPERVTAADPSEEYVAALRARHPGVEVIRVPAEDLPFEGGRFDATLAQLVINVMDDPVAGLREMARVTRSGGVVAACVWDFTEGGPLGPFWDAARALDPEVETGSVCPGSRRGHLAELFSQAGIGDIVDGAVAVEVEHATFEEWWEPFTLGGVAPSGAYVAGLELDRRTSLRELCRERLPEPPFVVSAKAWAARGISVDRGSEGV
jgi:SAM-dependent methyltransferase